MINHIELFSMSLEKINSNDHVSLLSTTITSPPPHQFAGMDVSDMRALDHELRDMDHKHVNRTVLLATSMALFKASAAHRHVCEGFGVSDHV